MKKKHAFLICFGPFLVQVGVFGLHNNFGLLFDSLLKNFKAKPSEAAWIGSLGMGITFLVSPLSQVMLKRVGFQKLIGLSLFLCFTSLMTTSFVENIDLFPITYSLLWGLGSGFANHASMVLVQETFDQGLSKANGFAMSGTGIGALILGQLQNWLLLSVGFRWTFRAYSLIPFLFTFLLYSEHLAKRYRISKDDSQKDLDKLIVSNTTTDTQSFKKIRNIDAECCEKTSNSKSTNEDTLTLTTSTTWQQQRSHLQQLPKRKDCKKGIFYILGFVDKELWQNKRYVVFVVGVSVFFFGSFIPFVFLIEHAIMKGISSTKAQFLISILCLVSTFVKMLSGVFLDSQKFISRTSLFIMSLYMMAVSNFIAVTATKYWQFCFFSATFGMFEGCFVGQLVSVLVDLLPSKEKIGLALGYLFAIMSIPVTIGPFVSGKLNDGAHNFVAPFYFASVVSLLGALITTAVQYIKTDDGNKQDDSSLPYTYTSDDGNKNNNNNNNNGNPTSVSNNNGNEGNCTQENCNNIQNKENVFLHDHVAAW